MGVVVYEHPDCEDVSHEDTLTEAEAARRESLGSHGRLVEDLIDQYTSALHDDATLEWFGKIAAHILDVRAKRDGLESTTIRIGIAAREARAKLADLVEEIDNHNSD